MIALLLAACWTRPDPELSAQRDALTAWEKGSAAMEAGDEEAALAAFREAQTHRPDDPVLAAWTARALASAGDLDGAIGQLDRALAERPGFAEARYNRACYRARQGDAEGAADDLEVAMSTGLEMLPRDIREDPDIAPLLSEPAIARLLPLAPLNVAVEGPGGAVFLGSEFPIRLRIVGAQGEPIGVSAEQAEGPFSLVEVVEDETMSNEGPLRDILWRFRAAGEGEIRFGPFHVYAGDRAVVARSIRVEAKAPPDHAAPPTPPGFRFETPRERAGRFPPPAAHRSSDGRLLVVTGPGDRADLDPPPSGDPIRYELRERGQPRWVALDWHAVPPGVRVRVVRAGETILDATP